MNQRALSLAVVGANFPNKRGPTRWFGISLCKPGDPIKLVREPTNPADPRAVAVYSDRNIQLGYLTAERAPMIGSWLQNGRDVRAIFQERTDYGAVIRIAVDGDRPTLPPHDGGTRYNPPEFWPDPVYDDD